MGKKRLLVIVIAAIMLVCSVFTYAPESINASSQKQIESLNGSDLMFVYRVRSFAWGFQDYAYLFSNDGVVKYVDIAADMGKDLSMDAKESYPILKAYMTDKSIPAIKTDVKVPYLVKLSAQNLGKITLKEDSNATQYDAGNRCYYCVKGKDLNKEMVLLKQTGEYPLVSKNISAELICKFIDSTLSK